MKVLKGGNSCMVYKHMVYFLIKINHMYQKIGYFQNLFNIYNFIANSEHTNTYIFFMFCDLVPDSISILYVYVWTNIIVLGHSLHSTLYSSMNT